MCVYFKNMVMREQRLTNTNNSSCWQQIMSERLAVGALIKVCAFVTACVITV